MVISWEGTTTAIQGVEHGISTFSTSCHHKRIHSAYTVHTITYIQICEGLSNFCHKSLIGDYCRHFIPFPFIISLSRWREMVTVSDAPSAPKSISEMTDASDAMNVTFSCATQPCRSLTAFYSGTGTSERSNIWDVKHYSSLANLYNFRFHIRTASNGSLTPLIHLEKQSRKMLK